MKEEGDRIMELQSITATVHLNGINDAMNAAIKLQEKINEAKTLAGELASLIEKLEIKIEM